MITDGNSYLVLPEAKDYKKIGEGYTGPNTGGMGCVSSPQIVTTQTIKTVQKTIFDPFMKGMKKESRPYTGILYLGAMLTKTGIKIVEFNARWGDPEAEVLVPTIATDYLSIVEAALNKKINKLKILRDNLSRVSVAGCSLGYPLDYSKVKGQEIIGLRKIEALPGVKVFGDGKF